MSFLILEGWVAGREVVERYAQGGRTGFSRGVCGRAGRSVLPAYSHSASQDYTPARGWCPEHVGDGPLPGAGRSPGTTGSRRTMSAAGVKGGSLSGCSLEDPPMPGVPGSLYCCLAPWDFGVLGGCRLAGVLVFLGRNFDQMLHA